MVEGSLRQQLAQALGRHQSANGCACDSCSLRIVWPLIESALAAARQETAQQIADKIQKTSYYVYPPAEGLAAARLDGLRTARDSAAEVAREVGAALARETAGERNVDGAR